MDFSTLLMGIVPLLAFVIIDTFFGMKAGLVTAVILAAAEASYSVYTFGNIDMVTGASFFLIVLMGFMSWKTKSEKFFLFQPVILSALFGAYLVITWLTGHPLILEMLDKYKDLMPAQVKEAMGYAEFREMFSLMSLTVGIGMFFHAAATAFAALKLNKWWWIAVRGVGFYFFFFTSGFIARLIVFGK